MKTKNPIILSTLLICFTLIGCFVAVSYLVHNWFMLPLGDESTVYWWFHNARRFPALLGLCIFPILLVLWIVLVRHRSYGNSLFGTGLLLTILLIGNAAACAATIPVAFEQNRLLASLDIREHVYYLDWSSKPGIGGDGRVLIALWECDSSGWVCRIIHREERSVLSDEVAMIEAEIRQTSDGIGVEMLVGGEVVYQHQP